MPDQQQIATLASLLEELRGFFTDARSEPRKKAHDPSWARKWPVLDYGIIVHCIPLARVYYVMPVRGGPIRECKLLTRGSIGLFGVYDADTIAPYTPVWFIYNSDDRYGYIIACDPIVNIHGTDAYNDVIVSDSNVGFLHDTELQAPISIGASGIVDLSGRTPEDSLEGGEFCRVGPTGTMIFLDSMLACLRASEACGFWAMFPDRLARMAGLNLQIWSGAGAEEHYVQPNGRGVLYFKGLAESFNDTVGLQPDESDYTRIQGHTVPNFRHVTIAGRVVGGKHECVLANWTGLSNIFQSYAGHIGLESATSIHLVKTPSPVVPVKNTTIIADQAEPGSTYWYHQPSTLLNDPHDLITDVRTLAVEDLHTLIFHGFGSPAHDGSVSRATYPSVAKSGTVPPRGTMSRASPPAPVKVQDPLTDGIVVYPTRAFISLLDDGSIVLADTYGDQLRLSRGCLYLNAALDAYIDTGRNTIVFGGRDVCVKARRDMDLTSSLGDVRFKAERNLHMLGGNSGRAGGVLIESKSTGHDTSDYQHGTGRNVSLPGITLVASKSNVVIKSRNIFECAWDQIVQYNPAGHIVRSADVIIDRPGCMLVQVFEDTVSEQSFADVESCKQRETSSNAYYNGPRFNVYTYDLSWFSGELHVAGDVGIAGVLVVGDYIDVGLDVLNGSEAAVATKQVILNAAQDAGVPLRAAEIVTRYVPNLETMLVDAYFSCRTSTDYAVSGFSYPEGAWGRSGVDWVEPPVEQRIVAGHSSGSDDCGITIETYPFPGELYYQKNTSQAPIIYVEPAGMPVPGTAYQPRVTLRKMAEKKAFERLDSSGNF